jgi:hypothetical protein
MQDLAAHGLDAAHLDQEAQVGDGDAGALDADDLAEGADPSLEGVESDLLTPDSVG